VIGHGGSGVRMRVEVVDEEEEAVPRLRVALLPLLAQPVDDARCIDPRVSPPQHIALEATAQSEARLDIHHSAREGPRREAMGPQDLGEGRGSG